MKKFVQEIVDDIKANPDSWVPNSRHGSSVSGLKKGNIVITGYGNGSWVSVIHVLIKGIDVSLGWMDGYHLETAVKAFLAEMSLDKAKEVGVG